MNTNQKSPTMSDSKAGKGGILSEKICARKVRLSSVVSIVSFCVLLTFVLSYHQPGDQDMRIPSTTRMAKAGNWVLTLSNHSRKVLSQAGQDGILEEIFQHVTPLNGKYVEFGFGYAEGLEQIIGLRNGTNTFHLSKKGWTGWLFDALIEYKPIGLYREKLSHENIVETFKKHNVPRDVDYVSIDVDSIDLWLLHALIKDRVYRPQVISIEYNANYPYESTVTCDRVWAPWELDIVFGTSMGAILQVGRDAGYVPVHVERVYDVFLVREESLAKSGGRGFTVAEMKARFPLPRRMHRYNSNPKLHRLVDYNTFKRTGNMEVARKAAEKDREQVKRLHRVIR